MKLLLVFLAVVIAVEACQHGSSPDSTVLSDTCDLSSLTCRVANDCQHGQQCCFQMDGCSATCYHPDGHGHHPTGEPHHPTGEPHHPPHHPAK